MSRLETNVTCCICKTVVATVNAQEVRPGIWANIASDTIPCECKNGESVLSRADLVEKYDVHKEDFERVKELSKPKPGRAK